MDDEVPIAGEVVESSANEQDPNPSLSDDEDLHGIIEWPEVEWDLPGRASGWEYDIPVPPDLQATLVAMLAEPGLIFAARAGDDDRIVYNWLRECVDTLTPGFETFLFCDFDEIDDVDEADLCARFCDLHDMEHGRVARRRDGRWLALADKPRVLGMSNDLDQLELDLRHRRMTLICIVEPGVYRALPLGGVRHLRVETLDFAWRQMIVSLSKTARDDDYAEHHRRVLRVLDEKKTQIDKICSDDIGRDSLREGLQTALGEPQKRLPEEVCVRAIELAVDNGRDSDTSKALQHYLGALPSDVTPGNYLGLDDLESARAKRDESIVIVIFVLWLCCRAQPGRENRVLLARYLDLLQRYLTLLAAMEEANLDAARQTAVLEDRDVVSTLSQIKTPAKKLLDRFDTLINPVIAQIRANRVQGGDARYIGYPEPITVRLSELFSEHSAYVAHHMRLFSQALRPLRSADPLQKRIGQMLFLYEAEQWGDISESAIRDRVVEKFVELLREGKREAGEAAARSAVDLTRLPPEMMAVLLAEIEKIVHQVGHHQAVTVKQIVELIAIWYAQKSKEAAGQARAVDLRRDFRRLATSLFKRLLEQGEKLSSMSFFRSLGAKQADLVDLGAIARVTLNRGDLDEITRLCGAIEGAVLSETAGDGKSRAVDAVLDRLKYATYRFVVDELSDEPKLSERKVVHRWAVSTLGNRVIQSCVAAFREADYSSAPHPDFSTDPMMSRILAEPDGIEVLVDTVMNTRIRDYPSEMLQARGGLMTEHPGNDARITEMIDRELGFFADQSRWLWFKVADGETIDDSRAKPGDGDDAAEQLNGASSGAAKRSGTKTDTAAPGAEQTSFDGQGAASSNDTNAGPAAPAPASGDGEDRQPVTPKRRIRLYRHFPVPRNDDERAAFTKEARLLPFRLLQEVHEMLLCSDRAEDAARLITRLGTHLNRKDRNVIQYVVKHKENNLKRHVAQLKASRKKAKRQGDDVAEVELWEAFASSRLRQTLHFKDVL